ncbi:MAG TPA: FtsX-like permease family protein [Thermoplasmata archaeon]|nr:FtsX-like permease family protein [Thermoplasmata archaeon]
MVDPVVAFLLLVLGVVALLSLGLALRFRLAFRIAMRNVRRGRGRTVLLILGLLVGTTIISGSFAVGDTIAQLDLHYTYLGIGYTDEAVYGVDQSGGFAYFPLGTYAQIAAGSAGDPNIVGLAPEIIRTVQALDRGTGVPGTNLNLIGVNGNQSSALGSFHTLSGSVLAGPAPGEALLDGPAAAQMNATAGQSLILFGPNSIPVTVQAIVQDDLRGGFISAGLGSGSLFLDLATAQQLENATGAINYIAVTNAGGQQSGVALSNAVSAHLNSTLRTVPSTPRLAVHEVLQDSVASATQNSQSISTIFLVLGLFSIVAGAMLIVGIFVMLAEERKGEMGMLRAVGMRRRDLIVTFYFEGLAYSAGSALAGTFVGVGVGYLLAYEFSLLFAAGSLTSSAILASFTVTTPSLVESYVLGFLLTLVTVILASWRASRLNIVRAIRDIPEPRPPLRVYTYLAYLGVVLVLLGGVLFGETYRGTGDVSYPIIGGGLLILGIGLVASRFAKNRPVFSVAGLALLLWGGIGPLRDAVLGRAHSGGIFVVFVLGIMMVFGALLLYVFNSTSFVNGLLRLLGGRNGASPATRMGLIYPSRQSTRTTINLSIFALVVFTMVAIATFGQTVSANLQNTTQTESGGYSFAGYSALPIPDLPGQVVNNSTLARSFAVAVPFVSGTIAVNATGFSPSPFLDSVYAAPDNLSAFASFYQTSQFPFLATWNGLSASAVLARLATDPTVAVVDGSYAPPTAGVQAGPTGLPHPTVTPGDTLVVGRPNSNATARVTVLGVFKETVLTGVWLNPGEARKLGYVNETAFLLTVKPGVSTTTAAQQVKIAFFRYGLVVFDITALLAQSIASTEGVIGLLEIFVGLGLAVGIAALGILALRAVVERRREIGMMRATGFRRGMILQGFVLEYSFVTLFGVGVGTILGLLIVYDLSVSSSAVSAGVSTFSVPVVNILTIVIAAYVLAMIAIIGPSIRASRIPPAEAVRATE